jgi:hypothetical protein
VRHSDIVLILADGMSSSALGRFGGELAKDDGEA